MKNNKKNKPLFKRGYNFHCSECKKDFKNKDIKEKRVKNEIWLVCPDCGEMLYDNKRT